MNGNVFIRTPEETAEEGLKAYTAYEGHHSQDTAPRKPFPATKLRHVLCLPRSEGLCTDKTTAQMTCQLDDCSQVAAHHIHYSLSCYSTRKTDISFKKQTMKSKFECNLWRLK